MYSLIKKGLFSLDAEQAHGLTVKALNLVGHTRRSIYCKPYNIVQRERQKPVWESNLKIR